MKPRFRKPAARGFTLMEILVVIVIIAVLAVISVSATRSFVAKAKNTKCVSNLRQLGSVAQLWISDHGGRMIPTYIPENAEPPATGSPAWTQWLTNTYLPGPGRDQVSPDSVFNCPLRKPPTPNAAQWWKDGKSYGMNNHVDDDGSFSSQVSWNYIYARIPDPGKIIYITEMGNPIQTPGEPNTEWVMPYNGAGGGGKMAFRHGAAYTKTKQEPPYDKVNANALFCDWHVEAVTREQVDYTTATGKARWRW
jgi:prepilin-type N-terminal cleavage/methylation domain-containing protein/prepilin-type processing-associated H-X9-DG protein